LLRCGADDRSYDRGRGVGADPDGVQLAELIRHRACREEILINGRLIGLRPTHWLRDDRRLTAERGENNLTV